MSGDFTPGVGGINHLDFEPSCQYVDPYRMDGPCTVSVIYFHRWDLKCGCRHDALYCGHHSAVKGAEAALMTSTQVLCVQCKQYTYGKPSTLLKCTPIPHR